jgi:hypothetical protein
MIWNSVYYPSEKSTPLAALPGQRSGKRDALAQNRPIRFLPCLSAPLSAYTAHRGKEPIPKTIA